MKILGASIEQAADAFLHAGYGSIVPPSAPLKAAEVAVRDPRVVLDVARALEIREPLSSVIDGSAAPLAGLVGRAAEALPLLAGVGLFFAALLVVELLPARWRRRRWLVAGAVVALLAVVSVGESRADPATETAAAASPTFLRPQQATEVILHGLIRDALMGANREVRELADLRPEIGLPRRELTAGEAYALAHFDHDGWGRPFRAECRNQTNSEDSQYREADCEIESAGADGVFDTHDDLGIDVLAFPHFWRRPRTVWVSERDGQPLLFVHRWPRPNFRYLNEALARELTGGELFDVLTKAEIRNKQQRRALRGALAQPAGETPASDGAPRLVMVRR